MDGKSPKLGRVWTPRTLFWRNWGSCETGDSSGYINFGDSGVSPDPSDSSNTDDYDESADSNESADSGEFGDSGEYCDFGDSGDSLGLGKIW